MDILRLFKLNLSGKAGIANESEAAKVIPMFRIPEIFHLFF